MTTIKLTERTLSILKNFHEINKSMVFNPGNKIDTIADTRKILASAVIEQEFTSSFGIYELSRFFGAISLFSDPEITIEKTSLNIHEGTKILRYSIADPRDVRPPMKNTFTKLPSVDASFTLTDKMTRDVIKAAGVLAQPDIVFEGDGHKITISTSNIEKPSREGYSEDVGSFTGGESPFKLNMKVDNLKLFRDDYIISLCFAMKIAQFEGKNVNYFIAAESSSVVPQ